MKILDRTPTEEAINTAAHAGCAFLMLGHGRFTLLDFKDWEYAKCFRWHYNLRGYAARLQHLSGRQVDQLIYLHKGSALIVAGNDGLLKADQTARWYFSADSRMR